MTIILTLILIIAAIVPTGRIYAVSDTFARITSDYAYLYASPNLTIQDNVICFLENTYFVEITLDYDTQFYKAIYNGVGGYVAKKDVTKIIGTPTKPYPVATISTISSKCYLRSTPKITTENIVSVIAENTNGLKYIGKVYGEEGIDYHGNLWYYVEYYGVRGYVYSEYINHISAIAINTEEVQPAISVNKNPTPITNPECGIIIIILSIPAIGIIIFMYRAPNPKPKTVKSIKKQKRVKKIDYDELL